MKTNIEKVTEIMEYSDYGFLAQAFVMDAILKHAQRWDVLTPEQVAEMQEHNEMLNMTSWQGVAREVLAKLK